MSRWHPCQGKNVSHAATRRSDGRRWPYGAQGARPCSDAAHVVIEDGAWGPTHAISKKELEARRLAADAVTLRSCVPASDATPSPSSVLARAHLYDDRGAFEVEGLAELVLEVPAVGKVQVHRVVEGQRVGRR